MVSQSRPFPALKTWTKDGAVVSKSVMHFKTAESRARAIKRWHGAQVEQWRTWMKALPERKGKEMNATDADLTVVRCWRCAGVGLDNDRRCAKCDGSGSVFWVNGYAFPYTPQGERSATAATQ